MQGGAIIALLSLSRSRFTSSLAPAIGDYSHGHDKRAMDRKDGAAALATCIVRTLQQSDPTFEERFLKNLDDAYHQFRDDNDAVGADGKPRDVIGVLEMLTWTNELLTGWNPVVGQGRPLLK
jgi:hypothetical protein